jgi:hypothetical protein
MRALLCLALSACMLTYGDPKVTTTAVNFDGPVFLRADRVLPASASLGQDGVFRIGVDTARACETDRVTQTTTTTTTSKQLSDAGVVYTVLSLGALVGGIYAVSTSPGLGDPTDGTLVLGVNGIVYGALGALFVAVGRYTSVVRWAAETRTSTSTAASPQHRAGVACTPAQLGELAVTTPWGKTTRLMLGADGLGAAPIDFRSDIPDPASRDGRSQIAAPWTVQTVAAPGLAMQWTPGAAEVEIAVAQLIAAKTRVIAGATPAVLVTTGIAVDEGTLQIGATSTLRITVENRGGSTATDVTATTKSDLRPLHDQTFQLGAIQPGTRVTRTQTVTIPADVADETAIVIVRLGEGHGWAPPEQTQTLPLARALCTVGKLTHAELETKRAKYKKLLDAGSITKSEYEKFEAELIRCLK